MFLWIMGPECILCRSNKDDEVRYGQFMKKSGIAVHYYCLLLTSNLIQRGNDNEGFLGFLPADIKKEAKRVSTEKCHYCRKKNANIACCANKCRRMFHLDCGINNGCVNQFLGTFRSFCHQHENYAKKIRTPAPSEICSICYDKLGSYKRHLIFKAPCCKSGWFHRWCIAKLAVTAGYFFKCPLCNNTDLFKDHFQRRSIFVPDQDAAWETEPNAFADLLERPNTCSADRCKCPHGRKYDTKTYDLLICDLCGSKACHNTCLEKGKGTKYACKDCEALLSSTELQETSNRIVEDVTIAVIEDNQDVDIESVDSPIKPGRRLKCNIIESDSDCDEESLITDNSDDECSSQFNLKSLMVRKKTVNLNRSSSESMEDLPKNVEIESEMPVLTPYKSKNDQEYIPRNKRRYNISSDSSPPLIDHYKGPIRKKPFLMDNSLDESDDSFTSSSSSSIFASAKRITRSQSKIRNTPNEARVLRERSKSSFNKLSPFSHTSWDLSDMDDNNISNHKLIRSVSVGSGFIETTRGVFRRSARLCRLSVEKSHSEDNCGTLESTAADQSSGCPKQEDSNLSLEQFGGCPSLQSCILKYNFKSRQNGVQLAC